MKYFKNFPFEARVSVKYEYHMRYQPTNSVSKYVPIVFGNDTKVLFDCKDEPIVYHSTKFKQKVAEGSQKYMFATDQASDL